MTELTRRRYLGVPDEARQVVVVTESTHWDPNWLLTSREYFRLCVRRTLDRALDALLAEPRRVYSLECVFFADLYWEARPARRETFRELVNTGRLRFTGSGVTTPDTLLPEDELLLRDLLIGQEWLRSRGMDQEPRVLYLPDSFGHSPGTPSLLAAAGVPYAAICRIDGMRFPGADLESAGHFPRPGTTAARLIDEGTADFVWRAPDGSEVVTHWMTYGYGHGDMIASGGLSRALGLTASWPDRREHSVAARIEAYVAQLTPLARTPYLLLPIGFDFVLPVPRLSELIDRWNEVRYERTGVWLVNAGLDDYFDLVAHHRELLPTLALDPNPYWMGFYASRPVLKSACRDLGRALVDADNEAARSAAGAPAERAWWTAAVSNHHDFVTGTAPDRVALGEQTSWVRRAMDLATAAGGPRVPAVPSGVSATPGSWERSGSLITVTTAALVATFDERHGGALVSLRDRSGAELVRTGAPTLELRSYVDSGGLWRMGQEFLGGRWARRDRSTAHPASIVAAGRPDGGVQVSITVSVDARDAKIIVEVPATGTELVVRTSVTAPLRRTVTLALATAEPFGQLTMHQPGGVVTRELKRWYEPTFWPLHSFVAAGSRLTLAVSTPTAVHGDADGTLEIVVARTAVKELAFTVVPVLAPAWGRRWGTQEATLAVDLCGSEPCTAAEVIERGRRLQRQVDAAVGRPRPRWMVQVDDPLVEVLAVKPASRGEGVIVRLRSWAQPTAPLPVRLTLGAGVAGRISTAWRADSRERDLEQLDVEEDAVALTLASTFATVRLIFDEPAAPTRRVR